MLESPHEVLELLFTQKSGYPVISKFMYNDNENNNDDIVLWEACSLKG